MAGLREDVDAHVTAYVEGGEKNIINLEDRTVMVEEIW